MNLYLLSFNNYYNRIVKKFDTLSEYTPYMLNETPLKYNFHPNDGVNTEQIINWTGQIPDYILVVDSNEIVSRWFVIEAEQTRVGQFKLTLHRDLIVDNYNEVVNAPCFIEKATLSETNPLIYNSENMTFNKIKTEETMLMDNSKCPWIVGYIAHSDGTQTVELNGTIAATPSVDITINGPITDWEYYDYLNTEYQEPKKLKWSYKWRQPKTNTSGLMEYDITNDRISDIKDSSGYGLLVQGNNTLDIARAKAAIILNKHSLQQLAPSFAGFADSNTIKILKSIMGKVISYRQDDSIIYKRITAVYLPERRHTKYITENAGSLKAATDLILTSSKLIPHYGALGDPEVYSVSRGIKLQLEDFTQGGITYTIPKERLGSFDAPYDIFCMPYANTTIDYVNTGTIKETVKTEKETMLHLATCIAEQNGAKVYDLQLLPYCPIPEIIVGNKHLSANNLSLLKQYTVIRNEGNIPIGVLFFPTKTKFSFDITLDNPITITDKKIQSECDMYRLVSPNYNGQFEFNAAKNNGIDHFNVDCTYIPFNPYIHINPDFKNLYGRDFDDARGLICGGDFSLARVTDNWTNYQINNKNYQNIFDRQIQSMEKQNKVQLVGDILSAGVGSASGAVAGAMAGSIVPGIGTAIGGIAGGLLSGGGGVGDVAVNAILRNDALDLKKDQFGYELGNIQAMPDSLAKTTAFNNNNKIFPILEYYTCTETEKEALRNKIKYNGMTVMTVGTIASYIRPEKSFIKGKLIRLEGIPDDFHCLNAIADEVNKGIFI